MRLPVAGLTSLALGFLAAPILEEAIEARAAATFPPALLGIAAFLGARALVAAAARSVALASRGDESLKTQAP